MYGEVAKAHTQAILTNAVIADIHRRPVALLAAADTGGR